MWEDHIWLGGGASQSSFDKRYWNTSENWEEKIDLNKVQKPFEIRPSIQDKENMNSMNTKNSD